MDLALVMQVYDLVGRNSPVDAVADREMFFAWLRTAHEENGMLSRAAPDCFSPDTEAEVRRHAAGL